MSTRYVWERFDVKTEQIPESNGITQYNTTINLANIYCAVAASECYYDSSEKRYKLSGDLFWITSQGFRLNGREYPYLAFISTNTQAASISALQVFQNTGQSSSQEDLYWYMVTGTASGGSVAATLYMVLESAFSTSSPAIYRQAFTKMEVVDYPQKGSTSKGKISSSRSNAYPINASSGSTWYEYLGSDSIDPSQIGYSTESPIPGKSLVIQVTAGYNTYGGTISYQYSYRLNGGPWINLGSLTTNTSIKLTVPENAETVQARVIASDNLGFSSTTYVMGEVLTVRRIQAYNRVNGAARQVEKMYVNIGGKAREVIAGYARVNGSAKKMF